jgi:hypothetical protein
MKRRTVWLLGSAVRLATSVVPKCRAVFQSLAVSINADSVQQAID